MPVPDRTKAINMKMVAINLVIFHQTWCKKKRGLRGQSKHDRTTKASLWFSVKSSGRRRLEVRDSVDQVGSRKSRHVPSEKLSGPFAMLNLVRSVSMNICRCVVAA